MFHEKKNIGYPLPLIIILQAFLDFYDDPIMYSRDFHIWPILKKLNENDWNLKSFDIEEFEKMIKLFVDLFYEIDIKATTENIKGILGNLMKFKPELKEKAIFIKYILFYLSIFF